MTLRAIGRQTRRRVARLVCLLVVRIVATVAVRRDWPERTLVAARTIEVRVTAVQRERIRVTENGIMPIDRVVALRAIRREARFRVVGFAGGIVVLLVTHRAIGRVRPPGHMALRALQVCMSAAQWEFRRMPERGRLPICRGMALRAVGAETHHLVVGVLRGLVFREVTRGTLRGQLREITAAVARDAVESAVAAPQRELRGMFVLRALKVYLAMAFLAVLRPADGPVVRRGCAIGVFLMAARAPDVQPGVVPGVRTLVATETLYAGVRPDKREARLVMLDDLPARTPVVLVVAVGAIRAEVVLVRVYVAPRASARGKLLDGATVVVAEQALRLCVRAIQGVARLFCMVVGEIICNLLIEEGMLLDRGKQSC